MRRTGQPDSGDTIIEVLLSVMLIGIYTAALSTGLFVTIETSATFKAAVAPANNVDLILQNWSDAIDQADYPDAPANPCDTAWVPPAPIPVGSTSTPTPITALSVQYWDGSAFTPTCGTDLGAQLVTLTVTAAAGDSVIASTQTISVVKRRGA